MLHQVSHWAHFYAPHEAAITTGDTRIPYSALVLNIEGLIEPFCTDMLDTQIAGRIAGRIAVLYDTCMLCSAVEEYSGIERLIEPFAMKDVRESAPQM